MNILEYFTQNFTKKQIIIGISALVVLVACITGGIIYYNHQMELKRALEEKDALKQEIVIECSMEH